MSTTRYYLLGAYTSFSSSNPSQINFASSSKELDRTDAFVKNGIWINGYSDKYLDVVNGVEVGDLVAIKSTNRNKRTMLIKAVGIVEHNYEDGRKLGVDWESDFIPFEVNFSGGSYNHTIVEVTNPNHLDQIWGRKDNIGEIPVIKIQRFNDFTESKLTFVQAAEIVLKQNGNKPMTAQEIWDQISSQNLVQSTGATPWSTLRSDLETNSINSTHTIRGKNVFRRVNDNPRKYVLINAESVSIPEEDDNYDDYQSVRENPFDTALCVIGKSGAGKSTLIEELLEKEGHVYEFIIPTASTTSLLAQFKPSDGEYVESRLGRLILRAVDDPNNFYTAVFDEMHKSAAIEMINDELLQAISIQRNQGRRFISVDGEIAELYRNKLKNFEIPKNFGFVFLTSKPKIVMGNPDFIRRVRVVNITEGDKERIGSIDVLLELSILGKDYAK